MDRTLSRRGFLFLGSGAALVTVAGCENLPNHTTWKPTKRTYPCGKYIPTNPDTWEYTVVTKARYSVKINGKWVKRPKIFILCGRDKARAHKRSYPKDSVTYTSTG